MTTNQIAYWNLQETKRANTAGEGIKRDTLDETRRNNMATLAETLRSNKEREKETKTNNRINSILKGIDIFVTSRDNRIRTAGSLIGGLIK